MDTDRELGNLEHFINTTKITCDAGLEEVAKAYVVDYAQKVAGWIAARSMAAAFTSGGGGIFKATATGRRPEPGPVPSGVRVIWGDWR